MEPTIIQQAMMGFQSFSGYIYPNEYELQWSLLIVLYPYLTGLVAGAFILASLERVFRVTVILPVYRLSLLTALAFLIVAPMPLFAHLGHPERALEMLWTPHLQSAMAMFGFVYAWYLLVVLLLEIWFDFRKDIVMYSKNSRGLKKYFYLLLTLGSTDISEEALRFDNKMCKFITVMGIPSAFLLHGYVGFIFGSIKANPWWSSVLMPIVFLFSAIVSGIALMILIYMVTTLFRWKKIDMGCLNKLAEFLFYTMIVDFSLELLDFIHRLYESEESIHILSQLITNRLFVSLIVTQIFLGSIVPILGLIVGRFGKLPDELRRIVYFLSAVLVQVGIFSIRWNVVIGGQLFSKSLRGLTVYKVQLLGLEGLLMTVFLLILPLFILYGIVKILPPWTDSELEVHK
ncbi:MAG: polysulfide reductase [Omnitrophica bacterium RIFCSPLOWO2_12_FULL_44_17]|uniref:Polysulfide reductase n=1 Tax=Candidatus Danuiimicrobium aquiferis TaxID=1801832 RepID=A0A1G1KRF8_9BACT|nr:MAG: polysulfide reductase [Omnitrophica bacterium RIFCSPHIGHO2_02_FULL_45_28]OGW88435.1 MAG: polysulfide reductase [Omnitrophica bacterium RIFCSPHIGHO2_12_FULL_44_12]OGW95405.1 MAG: polysulfide reductase [Omnitrophica bacterium RIFCSPLOWO2_12_FULL_44_17]OGX03287.1 MAG: polysulfide reductase [Omnitrophica bacterium RIFCSPLOWO2_02_FULL_44_11]